MPNFKALSQAAAALAMLATASFAKADAINLVTNGNFSNTTLTASSQFGDTYGGQTVAGWFGDGYTFLMTPGSADTTGATGQYGNLKLYGPEGGTSNSAYSNNGFTSSSPAGGDYIAMDGAYEEGSISQVLSGLTIGDTIAVSFWYAGAQQSGYNGATTEGLNVSLGNQTLQSVTLNNVNHGFTGWQYQTLNFTATGTSETLKFLATGTPGGEPPFTLLDGVTATDTAVTPEPSSIALLGTGLLTVGGLVRKRFLQA